MIGGQHIITAIKRYIAKDCNSVVPNLRGCKVAACEVYDKKTPIHIRTAVATRHNEIQKSSSESTYPELLRTLYLHAAVVQGRETDPTDTMSELEIMNAVRSSNYPYHRVMIKGPKGSDTKKEDSTATVCPTLLLSWADVGSYSRAFLGRHRLMLSRYRLMVLSP